MKVRWILAFAFSLGLWASQAPDMTGSWRLNVSKSTWGKKPKPTNVIVKVDQSGPSFQYSGSVTDASGNETPFAVDCPMDGQEHPVKTSYGPGKMKVQRTNQYSTTSEFRSDDGKYTESTTTTISRDGKELTRRMHSKGPDGEASWNEVYDRQ